MWQQHTANCKGGIKDKRKDICDVLKTDNSTVTSCTALYNMALWPGLSSISSVLQHWQWAALLISDHWRSPSTAGERPECNGFSLHSFSMVSWQGERNTVVKVHLAKIQQKYFEHVYLQWCPLISWITFEKPEENVKKWTSVCILRQFCILSKGHIFNKCLSSSFLEKIGS